MSCRPLTKKITDHSTESSFSFSYFCDICGKEWLSQVVLFQAGNNITIEHKEAKELLWADEHRTAFNEANLDARLNFTCCPRCGRWVCDDCCSPKEGVLCRECNRE